MNEIAGEEQLQLVSRLRQVYSVYQQNRDLVVVGAYQAGSNEALDEAIALWPAIVEFLRQHRHECVDSASSLRELRKIFESADSGETADTPDTSDTSHTSDTVEVLHQDEAS